MKKAMKLLLSVFLALVIIIASTYVFGMMYVNNKVSKIKVVGISKDPKEMGVDNIKFDKQENSITNILLLGTDSRDTKGDEGRSDAMMILTMDKKNNELKLTSIMRDSLVSIEGHGEEKITHANAYGGPSLSIKTVNQNYNMNIMDYVKVDFFGLERIIDYVGGVSIDITAEEIPIANGYINEVAGIENKEPLHIKRPGLQTLTGIQAVGYCRIRYVGNSDFQRTERQRLVLSALFGKLKTKSIIEIPGAVNAIIPCVETSINSKEIIAYSTYILTHRMFNIEQSRVPYDGMYKDAMVNDMSVLIWDKPATIEKLHSFIFGAKSN